MQKIETGLHLEALFGNVLALTTAVVERMREAEPTMYAKAVRMVESGLGSLEARVLVEPAPMVILLIRVDEETALELARLPVPNITARH